MGMCLGQGSGTGNRPGRNGSHRNRPDERDLREKVCSSGTNG